MSLDASDSAVPQIAGTAAPRISWVPPAGGFAGLSMLNGLLRILTLGVYHFWGKTEVRQRIWSAVRIDGEPLEYRGTGGELFRGFLVVFFLILLPMGLASFGSSLFLPTTWQGVYQMAFWGMLFLETTGTPRLQLVHDGFRIGIGGQNDVHVVRSAGDRQ